MRIKQYFRIIFVWNYLQVIKLQIIIHISSAPIQALLQVYT